MFCLCTFALLHRVQIRTISEIAADWLCVYTIRLHSFRFTICTLMGKDRKLSLLYPLPSRSILWASSTKWIGSKWIHAHRICAKCKLGHNLTNRWRYLQEHMRILHLRILDCFQFYYTRRLCIVFSSINHMCCWHVSIRNPE